MTLLGQLIARRIAATGPIPLSEYMAECLLHPQHGYYTRGDAIGATGDFTTAPEISQMFGELVGLALAQAWLDQGAPSPVALVELGPGHGTLMADALRAIARVPGLSRPSVHLVEASTTLRARQRDALKDHNVTWHDRVETVPEGPVLVIANEFLDALPIRQFYRDTAGWRETMVGQDTSGDLCLGLSAPAPVAALDHRLDDTDPGDIVELCPALPAVVTAIAARIGEQGGAALFIDYGDWRSRGDTFQAVQNHRPTAPLTAPGEADLTAQVDFEAVANAARTAGTQVSAMTWQGDWLHRLGIAQRSEQLAAALPDGPRRANHLAAYRRLTDPAEMGSLFKVLGISPVHAQLPPGLTP